METWWLRGLEIFAGFYYLIFGLDGFLKKIPLPVPSPKALKFLESLAEVKYLLFTVKLLEILIGLSWIFGVGTGLAWILWTPIWFNILMYHFWVNRQEKFWPLIIFIMHLCLAFKNASFLSEVWRLGWNRASS